MCRDPPPSGGSLSRHVSRRPSRRDPATSELPQTHIEFQQFDTSKPQDGQAHNQVYGHTGGAGTSHSNLRDTLGGRNASKRDMTSKGSHELPVREPVFPIAETFVGLDLSQGLDDNDEGRYWSGLRRDNRGASRMSPF